MLTNLDARAVFETVVNKILAVPENLPRTRALFQYFHHYESQFGELAQIVKLEQRMATLWPNDPQLQRFAERYAGPTFDPTNVRPIVSPRTQMKPVMPNIAPSVEEPQPVAPPQLEQRLASPPPLNSPRLQNLMPVANVNSPKRPLEDFDDSAHRSKIARGESPALKGAAGRRLDAARRNLGASGNTPVIQGPTPLPRELNFVLSIIPGAHLYDAIRFSPEGIVNLLRGLNGIPMPTLPAGAGAPGQRWGTTPTTAQQLASIQEKYGAQHPGHAHTPSWG